VMTGRRYLCVPCLDAAAPERGAFQRAVEAVAFCRGGIYVHCALGHGRSATLVIAALLARGAASSVSEAEILVKKARPGIGISPAQRALLLSLDGTSPERPMPNA